LQGLTNAEAEQLLKKFGRNFVAEKRPNRLFTFLLKFWAPIPWMLEITIVLQAALGKWNEAVIIIVLLVFNSILSFLQEERANKALALLRENLHIKTRVLRDNVWQLITADRLVPNDIVHLSAQHC
jgi:H+-transporting ATPase